MHTYQGVEVFLENIQYIHSRRLKGDLDAVIYLLDFDDAKDAARLSKREIQALKYRYEMEFTIIEACKAMDLSINALTTHIARAIKKIAIAVCEQEGKVYVYGNQD